MKLMHYDIPHEAPLAWYGYQRVGCPQQVSASLMAEKAKARQLNCISEREFEVDLFLSALASINKKHVAMIECGAGWGEWCLALAGVIENAVIPVVPKTYGAIGIEGDRYFYNAMNDNFAKLGVGCMALYGSIGDRLGIGKFNTGFISHNCCGGNDSSGMFRNSRLLGRLLSMINTVAGKSQSVPLYTVDVLAQKCEMSRIDILHIDVQGSELDVLRGASSCLKRGKIGYILVGTHGEKLHNEVINLLSNTHSIVAYAKPGRINKIKDMPDVWIEKGQDGLILAEAKRL